MIHTEGTGQERRNGQSRVNYAGRGEMEKGPRCDAPLVCPLPSQFACAQNANESPSRDDSCFALARWRRVPKDFKFGTLMGCQRGGLK